MRKTLQLAAVLAGLSAGQVQAQELQNQGGDFIDATTGFDFTIEVDADKSSTVIGYGGYVGSPGGNAGGTDLTWSLSAEFPVGGKDNLASSDTLDRLSGGPKVSLAFNFLFSGSDSFALDNYKFRELNREALAACRAETGPDKPTEQQCQSGYELPNEDFIRTHLPQAELRMNRIVLGGYSTLGIEASIGTEKFDFVTPGTLAESSKRHVTWSVGAGFAHYPDDAVSAIKFDAEYSRAPEELSEAVVCKTVIVTPADDCVNALSRAPVLEDALTLKGEYRRFFPFRNGKGGIGAALTAGYDVLSDDWQAELPIYFSIPGKSAILPGITVGYKSKDDKVTVGLFLKTAFSF